MAFIYFTNNADSGDGTLRAAIAAASVGDTIAPSGFASGDIEILLASYLPTKSVTIDAGENNRIILNAQDYADFMRIGGSSYNITFRKVFFKNGTRDASAPINCSGVAALTFDRCIFEGNSGGASGLLNLTAAVAGAVTFTNCAAFNNANTGSGPTLVKVAPTASATLNVNDCTFATVEDVDAIADGGQTVFYNSLIERYNGAQIVNFSAAGMVDEVGGDLRLTPSSPYLTGGNSAASVDILGHARAANGAVGAYEGSWFVVPSNEERVVVESITADYVEVGDGAEVSIVPNATQSAHITARKEATIGAAYFTSESTTYLATPSAASGATYLGVLNVHYGAGLSAFSGVLNAGAVVFSLTTAAAVPCLIERYNAETGLYDAVTTEGTTGTTTTASGGLSFRAFDGATFLYTTIERTVGGEFWRVQGWGVSLLGGQGPSGSGESWTATPWAISPIIEAKK